MLAGARCGAPQPRPVHLRGAALPAPVRWSAAASELPADARARRSRGRNVLTAPAPAGCAGRRVRLGALRLSAAAAGEPVAETPRAARRRSRKPAAEVVAAPVRGLTGVKPRVPHPGVRGAKTAEGRPKPDDRTVADLVLRGWYKSEKEVVALLTKSRTSMQRYPFETAEPAADWLDRTLGTEPFRNHRLSPAAKAVKTVPSLLTRDTETLQRNWDALLLPEEEDGIGCELTASQAREVLHKFPTILCYTMENLRRGWLMMTAAPGLGLSPEEARTYMLQQPQVLISDFDKFTRRVELLKSLGFAKAYRMVFAQTPLQNAALATVKARVAWWKQTGLDYVKLLTTQPTLLCAPEAEELQARLDFLRHVAGMDDASLNNAPFLFCCRLSGRLRPRFFYAQMKGMLGRFSRSTLMQPKDAVFLAWMQGQPSTTKMQVSNPDVERYRKLIKSPNFVAWRLRQEARIKR